MDPITETIVWLSAAETTPPEDSEVLVSFVNDRNETGSCAARFSDGTWYWLVLGELMAIDPDEFSVHHWADMPRPASCHTPLTLWEEAAMAAASEHQQ